MARVVIGQVGVALGSMDLIPALAASFRSMPTTHWVDANSTTGTVVVHLTPFARLLKPRLNETYNMLAAETASAGGYGVIWYNLLGAIHYQFYNVKGLVDSAIQQEVDTLTSEYI